MLSMNSVLLFSSLLRLNSYLNVILYIFKVFNQNAKLVPREHEEHVNIYLQIMHYTH